MVFGRRGISQNPFSCGQVLQSKKRWATGWGVSCKIWPDAHFVAIIPYDIRCYRKKTLGQGLAQRSFLAGLGPTLIVHYLVNGNGPFEKVPDGEKRFADQTLRQASQNSLLGPVWGVATQRISDRLRSKVSF